jgi:hypothetical protein
VEKKMALSSRGRGPIAVERVAPPTEPDALRCLIEYGINEAIEQDLPLTAYILELAKESLECPEKVEKRIGGPLSTILRAGRAGLQ